MDECNSEFYSFRQRVVDHYLQIPAGEESDVLKEFKNLIRSQDLEIKQLKIQLSAGGNVESEFYKSRIEGNGELGEDRRGTREAN